MRGGNSYAFYDSSCRNKRRKVNRMKEEWIAKGTILFIVMTMFDSYMETKAFSWETLCAVATAMHFMIPVVGTEEER